LYALPFFYSEQVSNTQHHLLRSHCITIRDITQSLFAFLSFPIISGRTEEARVCPKGYLTGLSSLAQQIYNALTDSRGKKEKSIVYKVTL